jgi:pyruvate,orthophosphate dikinase
LDALARAEAELAKRPEAKDVKEVAAAAKKAAKASLEVKEYEGALKKLLPLQRKDFEGIFKAMDGLPVIIRLIDPPLHEFLPSHDELLAEVTEMRTLGKKARR